MLGIGFLLLLDVLLPHLHVDARQPEGLHSSWRRTTLLVLAVTLHNIPEGMAVGLSFALAAQHAGEGRPCPGPWRWLWELESRTSRRAAISCPCGRRAVRRAGFLYGSLRRGGACLRHPGGAGGGDDPAPHALAAVLRRRGHDVCGCGGAHPRGPLGEHSNTGTLGVMAGFLLMMVLDVALG